jgi:predicted DNA binding CopG/RHH family protein
MKNSKKVSKKKVSAIDPLAGDLSDLLQGDSWQRVRFELQPKNKTITIRMSEDLLEAVKEQAEKSGLDYQKFIRLTLEKIVAKAS